MKGHWVRSRDYSKLYGIPPQTLKNWRCKDKREGRRDPKHPKYCYMGRSVRYWIGESTESTEAPATLPELLDKVKSIEKAMGSLKRALERYIKDFAARGVNP